LIAACLDAATIAAISPGGAPNFMRLMFEPGQMRGRIRNWSQVRPTLVARLRREAAGDPSSPSARLLDELAPGAPQTVDADLEALAPTVRVELAIGDGILRLFNAITTFGTPQDVTVQELRIEMSFPADSESEALLRRLS
jgi:transcription regulator MmyB-like protein